MARINRNRLVDLMVEEFPLPDTKSQRLAMSKFSGQQIIALYLTFKGIFEFEGRDDKGTIDLAGAWEEFKSWANDKKRKGEERAIEPETLHWQAETDKLRPCVCGKSLLIMGPLSKKLQGHKYVIFCENCGREAISDTREQAIKLWDGGEHGIHNG
jgi:hypothetical protein